MEILLNKKPLGVDTLQMIYFFYLIMFLDILYFIEEFSSIDYLFILNIFILIKQKNICENLKIEFTHENFD